MVRGTSRFQVASLKRLQLVTGSWHRLYDDDVVTFDRCLNDPASMLIDEVLTVWSMSVAHTLTRMHLLFACRAHNVLVSSNALRAELLERFMSHLCTPECPRYMAFKRPANSRVNPFHVLDGPVAPYTSTGFSSASTVEPTPAGFSEQPPFAPNIDNEVDEPEAFPPRLPTAREIASMVTDYKDAISGWSLHESACAVCGSLVPS